MVSNHSPLTCDNEGEGRSHTNGFLHSITPESVLETRVWWRNEEIKVFEFISLIFIVETHSMYTHKNIEQRCKYS